MEAKLSTKQKVNALKLIHFSLLIIEKSTLLSQILGYIPYSELDNESSFEFLNFEKSYSKVELKNDSDKKKLKESLSRYFGNSDEIYRLKVDLHMVSGQTLPFMKELNEVKKIFDRPLE